ncbi:MAG: dTDP-4-dehydrorhamnose 3,5-epimerase family protein [Magnetococcales bacterium]|nr:dTDP-4-dehydrorhamnose 3,5-epimerase family protein [Magnetococcales bacterium]
MNILPTPILDLKVVETSPFEDVRGAFARLYCEFELADLIGQRRIVQINHSRTVMVGAMRGMHFQLPPYSEMKLVRCLKGRVWDVVVDLRQGSPTFLHWHAEELTPAKMRMMVIPEGFAHGFQVMEPESELLYLHTAFYSPGAEGGLRHDDPRLGIAWPLAVTDLSARDANHPMLEQSFQGITL